MNRHIFWTLAPLTLALALAGCDRGSSGSTTPTPTPPPPVATYSVGGTLSGLPSGKSVTLQDNGGDDLTLIGTGSSQNFTFATSLASGASYAVAVSTQPVGMKCSVTNGSGTMGGSAVNTVAVNCLNLGETVLHSFGTGTDGKYPSGHLSVDASGTLYGTTFSGGTNNKGTVFKLTPAGAGSVLWSFGAGTDGQSPLGGVIQDANGTLYGTTYDGGLSGYGTVFKITPAGAESVLWPFAGGDGAHPFAGLIQDASGNFYGTTTSGGTTGNGTVFKITPAGVQSVLYSFAGGSDGQYPNSSLLRDANGNLYGTTNGGGTSGYGTVFKITSAGIESVLWSFGGPGDGQSPVSGLVQDASGNLYGTTPYGGTGGCGMNGCGTVFKITPSGAESVLYSFVGGINDGQGPNGDLVQDANGNFYGTTQYGGTNNKGTVFKITSAGTESVLHSFGTGTDGQGPQSGLTLDANGNLYGTTNSGGTNNMGTVFVIVP